MQDTIGLFENITRENECAEVFLIRNRLFILSLI
jgi:hypothetical protein